MYYEGIRHICRIMKKSLTGLIIIVFGICAVATPLSLIQVDVSQDKLYNSDDIPIKEDPNKGKVKDIECCVDFDPDTLNCKSKGKWITVRIHFSGKKDVTTVDYDSILFNNDLQPNKIIVESGSNDNFDRLIIKFDRSSVINLLLLEPVDTVEISITGIFTDGITFKGKDSIRLINF